jgi:hypothetical protein
MGLSHRQQWEGLLSFLAWSSGQEAAPAQVEAPQEGVAGLSQAAKPGPPSPGTPCPLPLSGKMFSCWANACSLALGKAALGQRL